MKYADLSPWGRFSVRMAVLFAPAYKARYYLSKLNKVGYISYYAEIFHTGLSMGKKLFIGDRVVLYSADQSGCIELGDAVHLYSDIIIETALDGRVSIGSETHIQARCKLAGVVGSIIIGERVEIAANCAFYPYNHAIVLDIPIRKQGITSKGNIIIGDDAWLGYGVIVLDGVRIGAGAVIGAGSVVTCDVPDNAIAVGNPARVIRQRVPAKLAE